MICTMFHLVSDIGFMEGSEIVVELRPHERKRLRVIVERRIQWSEGVVVAKLTINYRNLEFLLFVQGFRNKSKVGREEPTAAFLHRGMPSCDVYVHCDRITGWCHLREIIEYFTTFPLVYIQRCELRFYHHLEPPCGCQANPRLEGYIHSRALSMNAP